MNGDGSLHILHIEDDENDAEAIWEVLEKGGLDYHVTLVAQRGSYEEALQGGDVDLVLSDNRGLDFEGGEALRYVHTHHPSVPFLFLSDSYVLRGMQALKAEGAADCFFKARLGGLVPAIRRAIVASW